MASLQSRRPLLRRPFCEPCQLRCAEAGQQRLVIGVRKGWSALHAKVQADIPGCDVKLCRQHPYHRTQGGSIIMSGTLGGSKP